MAAGIEDEPALSGMPHAGSAGGDAIGDEPALSESPEAVCDKTRRDVVVREMWADETHAIGVAHFLWLCVASGAFAVICALAKGVLGLGVLAVCVGAPVIEEMAKVVLPMMWLEKAPWRFRSAGTIVLACLASALVFATIENLLYFHVYIPEDKCDSGIIWFRLIVCLYFHVYIPEDKCDSGIIWFRLIVCTSVHVICTITSAFGLARAWREARDGAKGFSSATAMPYLVVAMIVHGIYNVVASLVSFLR